MNAMKRCAWAVLLLALCGAALAGCVQPAEIPQPSVSAAVTASASPDATPGVPSGTPVNTPEAGQQDDGNQCSIGNGGNAVLKELAFVSKGNAISISDIADDEAIERLLGKAVDTKAHTYSKDDGRNMDQLLGRTEKQYVYEGLVIKTIDTADGNQFYIFNIEITDAKYPTLRNIKVGDSLEKLMEAYPEGYLAGGEPSDGEDDFHYQPVDYVDGMIFHINNRKIESIKIYTLLD